MQIERKSTMSRNDEHLRFSPRRSSSMEIYRKKKKRGRKKTREKGEKKNRKGERNEVENRKEMQNGSIKTLQARLIFPPSLSLWFFLMVVRFAFQPIGQFYGETRIYARKLRWNFNGELRIIGTRFPWRRLQDLEITSFRPQVHIRFYWIYRVHWKVYSEIEKEFTVYPCRISISSNRTSFDKFFVLSGQFLRAAFTVF